VEALEEPPGEGAHTAVTGPHHEEQVRKNAMALTPAIRICVQREAPSQPQAWIRPSAAAGADHVLARPSKRDAEAIAACVVRAADAVEVIATEGVAVAMNRFNGEGEDTA